MEARDVAELFIAAVDKIEIYWNFYVVMLIALIGWLISLKNALPFKLKLVITVGYLAFALMNISGLYGSYTFAEALRLDMMGMEKVQELKTVHKILSGSSYQGQMIAMFVIHLVVGTLVLAALWFGRFGSKSDIAQGGHHAD